MSRDREGRKLSRSSSHRISLLRNQATSLFKYERIKTTLAKAKELRKFAENLITIAKRGDLSARREVARHIKDKGVLKKLFGEIAPRYKDRNGGYTRIIRIGYRTGDGALISLIELV